MQTRKNLNTFDNLSERKRYGSNRRASLLSYFLREKPDKIEWLYTLECELERLLKRKIGFSKWDKNWDVGLHMKEDDIFIMLSQRNELGSFIVLEKVKYEKGLDASAWLLDCISMYIDKR